MYKKYEHRPHDDSKFHYFCNQHFGYGVVHSGFETKVTPVLPDLRGAEKGGPQEQS